MIGLLHLAPILLLVMLLACGRYPGSRSVARVAARAPHRPAPRAARMARPAVPTLALVRGGLLLARSLAVRPPPGPVLA